MSIPQEILEQISEEHLAVLYGGAGDKTEINDAKKCQAIDNGTNCSAVNNKGTCTVINNSDNCSAINNVKTCSVIIDPELRTPSGPSQNG